MALTSASRPIPTPTTQPVRPRPASPARNAYQALSPAERSRVNRMNPAEYQAWQQAQRGGGGATSGASGGAGAGGAPSIDFRDPVAISAEVARRGLNVAQDPTTVAAQTGVRNILSGQGGADSGGTGYQGYNPISDALAQRLLAEPTDADELVRQFLGSAGQVGGRGAGGGNDFSSYTSRIVPYQRQGGYGGSSGGGGPVPDTVGNSSAYFADQIKHLMDSQASDADLQAVIDAQNADINRGMNSSLWDLDAQAARSGRFGGDTWAALGNQARGDAVKQMGTFASQTRLNELANRRALYENLLGQVNTRDIAAMQDATSRYGIDASASSAGAGAAANAAATKRAQDLQALGMLLQNQQFGTSQLGDLGSTLGQNQLAAMGIAPDLAGVGLAGLGAANQAAGNQIGLRTAGMQAGVARSGQNLQAQMFNSQLQQNMLNDYLRAVMGVGGMGGSSTTTGTNVVPGLGISPTGAAIMGGAGGYLAGRGY